MLENRTDQANDVKHNEVCILKPLTPIVVDNLPHCNFDAAVNCKLDDLNTSYTVEQYLDLSNKPNQVLIDARAMSLNALQTLVSTYLKHKQHCPCNEAVVLTDNHLTSQHLLMKTFQHTYTVGLRTNKCKIWHDPPSGLRPKQQLSSIFNASIAGAKANILLDTGAAANCISEDFCRMMHIRIHSITNSDIISADGKTCPVKGVTVVNVALQTYKAKLRFLVIPMARDCDAILGEPWHAATKAVSVYGSAGLQTVRLYKGRSMRKLVQSNINPASQDKASTNSKVPLSHLQFAKAAEKHVSIL